MAKSNKSNNRDYRKDPKYLLLSPREKEVFALLLVGKSNPEIGHDLGISIETVKIHVSRILKKTGRRNRIDVIVVYGSTVG